MFNCYAHGWSSHVYTCPACTNFVTISSSVVPNYIVGISGYELSKLKEENARLREALSEIAKSSSGCECCTEGTLSREELGDAARAALEEK